MAHLTKVATLADSILQKMSDLGRWQYKFLLHLFPLLLSIRGRTNFTNLARYSDRPESTYRKNYADHFDWLSFNSCLVQTYLSPDRIIALDPSFIAKSGKHSDGVAYFWSGAAGQAKWGQEFCGLAAVDLCDKTALHLVAIQTLADQEETLIDYYASIITLNSAQLLKVSDYVVADAYFGKSKFIDRVTASGLQVITRLRKDQVLFYLYHGPRRAGAGAPRRYDGSINYKALRADTFTPCAVAADKSWTAFEAVVYVKAWKRKARVVVQQRYDDQGKVTSHTTFASTDTALSGGEIILAYQARFQQEFLYRDAKQELGLEDCQAYSWQKIDFHLNASLTTVSLAKAAHHLQPQTPNDEPFSIADIKTRYINESMALRIIRGCGISPDSPIIRKLLPKIRKLGQRRA